MSRVLYFAYGSNLDAEQMGRRCPSARPLGRARLAHHRLDFTHLSRRWGGGAADVVICSGESVWGVLYELAGSELGRLDRFEGGYQRIHTEALHHRRGAQQVITYTVPTKRSFPPTRRYLDKMLHWGERFDLPDDYLAPLRARATWEDVVGPVSPARAARSPTRRPRPPR